MVIMTTIAIILWKTAVCGCARLCGVLNVWHPGGGGIAGESRDTGAGGKTYRALTHSVQSKGQTCMVLTILKLQ